MTAGFSVRLIGEFTAAMKKNQWIAAIWMAVACAGAAAAANWPQFRGPEGSATADASQIPDRWSDTENLAWRAELPGPGSSSPIVWGDRVFVTCYSGYGVSTRQVGEPEMLKRHLLCFDRKSGRELWRKMVDARLPEDPYRGYITEHGYATNSPVTDGERVYAFFGKTGVIAFDMDGRELWRADVGQESSDMRWGSAASLILHKESVIVNAAEESESIRALDRKTGKELWKAEAGGLALAFGTPALVKPAGGPVELAIAVPGAVWGLDPDTGKLLWQASVDLANNVCPSITAADGVVYVAGGFMRVGSGAIRAGGRGDVTGTHVLWFSKTTTYVPSPLFQDGYLYWVNDQGVAHCLKASDGSVVYQERLKPADGMGRPRLYASLVRAGSRLYAVTRNMGTFVLKAGPQFEQIVQNQFAGDASQFNATPALSENRMFLRSDRYLYCVASPDAR